MKIPTWKVGCYYDSDQPELWREYEAHIVDDAVKMFILDCEINELRGERLFLAGEWMLFVAQCTNYGDGAILKVEVEAVPQIAYEMTVEPLCKTE